MDPIIKLKTNWNLTKGPRIKIQVKISLNKKTTLRFWTAKVNFKRKERKK
jgi:hypothetical protein